MLVTTVKSETAALCFIDCGLADYREILQLQHELHEKRRGGEVSDTVLLVEHPPTITLGARQSTNKLIVNREELARLNIDVVEIRRGGGTTAHNPGQLVFYPILNLHEMGLGISEYIRELEAIGIELLAQFGVRADRWHGLPGLWITEYGPEDTPKGNQRATSDERRATKKIASIGVRVSKGVTYHGMAINIQNDLSIFDLIIPCGLDDVEMTSVLKETGIRNETGRAKKKLAQILTKHLGQKENKKAKIKM
jgi:lipoate-protein ligase B